MNIIDLHCDTISRILDAKDGSNLKSNSFHIDIDKLQQGDYALQTFAMYMDLGRGEDVYENCLRQYDLFLDEMEANKDCISQVTTYEQYLSNKSQGKISALLSIEEGAACKESVDLLKDFYAKGVRMMTFTWNYPNGLAYPNSFPEYIEGCKAAEPDRNYGLTETGLLFLEEMANLNMILDVSHLGDKGIYDVLHHAKGPVIASHSNARTLCGHLRNLEDDMIKAIGQRGGVIGLNFYPVFLENKEPQQCVGSVDNIIRHMKYLKNIGGIECVALGTDFDGMDGTLEIQNASQMPKLVKAMETHGFTDREVELICFKNAERVLKEVL